MAGNVVSEIFSVFGIKINPGEEVKLRDLVKVIGDLNMSSVASAIGIGSVGVAMAQLADKTSETAQALENLHLYTGVPLKEIQQFENFAHMMGVAKGEADGMVESFVKMVGTLRQTNQGLGILHTLKVNPDETDPLKIFMALRKGIGLLSKNPADKLFLQGLINTSKGIGTLMNLPMSNEEMEKKIESMQFNTDKQIESWAKTGQSWRKASEDAKILFIALTPLADALEKIGSSIDKVILKLPKLHFSSRGIFDTIFKATPAGQGLAALGGVMNHNTINIHISNPVENAKKVAEEIKKEFENFIGVANYQKKSSI